MVALGLLSCTWQMMFVDVVEAALRAAAAVAEASFAAFVAVAC
uniref:Uncharacterized protein n=1 Tax=Anguilla anguilla TaxID=7936 RepID=A0A0E9UF86_ANGAN